MAAHFKQSGEAAGRLGENQLVLLRRVARASAGQELEAMQDSLRGYARRAALAGSIGTASFPEDAGTAEDLLAIAEGRMCLNQRKAEERDRRVAEIAPTAPAYEASAVA